MATYKPFLDLHFQLHTDQLSLFLREGGGNDLSRTTVSCTACPSYLLTYHVLGAQGYPSLSILLQLYQSLYYAY